MSSTESSSSSVRSMAEAMIIRFCGCTSPFAGRSAWCWLVSYMPLGRAIIFSNRPQVWRLVVHWFIFTRAGGSSFPNLPVRIYLRRRGGLGALGLLFVKQQGVADAADTMPTYQVGARVELLGLRTASLNGATGHVLKELDIGTGRIAVKAEVDLRGRDLEGRRRDARRSPRRRGDARGGGTDRAARLRRRASVRRAN